MLSHDQYGNENKQNEEKFMHEETKTKMNTNIICLFLLYVFSIECLKLFID